MNHQNYAKEILEKLENKYGKQFELVRVTYEVSGNAGNHYRAVCKEKDSSITFVAYYYLKGSDYLLSDEVGNELSVPKGDPILIDYYPNLLLNLKVADYLVKSNEGVLFVVADIGAFDYTFTVDDVEKGVEHCVSNSDFDVQSKLYLFANDSIENKEQFENGLVQKILSMNAYNQAIDIAYISVVDLQEVESDYRDDIYMIEDRLKEDKRVTRYSWYYAERSQGIIDSKNVKGV